MTGPQGAGTFAVHLPTGPEFVGENSEDFTVNAGTWDWNLLAGSWLITDLGDANYTISGGELHGTNVNRQGLFDNVRASARNMWGSIENREDLTVGGDRVFRVFINFSRFANHSLSSAAYWVEFGRTTLGTTADRTFVSIGKTWNGTDTTFATQYNPIPVGAVIRIRHDGLGLLVADIDGVDVLAYVDTCFLRALGGGMGWGVASGDISVDNLQFGILDGGIGIPVPWYQGDAADTNQLAGALWTTSGAWPQRDTAGQPLYKSSSGTSTTWIMRLTDTGLLLGDCFVEATMTSDTSVKDLYANLRASTTLTTGYYARWTSDGGGKWQIGKHGTGELASSAASDPGDYRMRFEAEGNALRLFQEVAGAWVLRVSTTDASFSAGTIAFAFNDVFSQGIPYVHDIVVGNIASSVNCTVERKTTSPTTAAHIDFEIIFDEQVTGFVAGDIVLSGDASTGASVSITGSGRKYTATVTGMKATGVLQLDVPAACCTALTHGASNAASTSIDNTVDSGLVTLPGMRGIWDANEFTSGTSQVKNWAGGAFDPTVGQMDNAYGSNLEVISGRQWYSMTYTNSNSRLLTNGTSPMNGLGAPQWLMIVVDTNGDVVFYDCADSGSARCHCYNFGVNISMYASSAVNVDTDDNNAHVYFFLWNGASSKFFKDGALIGTFNPGTPSVAGSPRMAIGNVAAGGVPGSAGSKFGMWMVGDGVPSDADIIACMENWEDVFSL